MIMVGQFVSWCLVIGLVGWLAFPLVFRIFSFLPERGLAFARPFGLLLLGYIYWLLVSLGVLQNDLGGVIFALLVVGGLSFWSLRQGRWQALAGFLKERRAEVVASELLFLLAFGAWAVVRAANPDASGAEKPMELAFINAILRSPGFPPSDPWLSGYAISYYYFGYVIVAMLARLAAVPGAVAFNLAVAAWFGLSALAAYGLLYNLLALRAGLTRRAVRLLALLAPLFLLVVSNLGGFLEVLHSGGVFWKPAAAGGWQSEFWTWLDIQELNQPPSPPFTGEPERPGGIWWWRSSRVLQDYTLGGQPREVIDEFPMFSYLLGDLHPHVLAMPFALLAAALALNIFLARSAAAHHLPAWPGQVRSARFWPAALALGGMAFLNTWDFPIYLALFAAATVLPDIIRRGWSWQPVFDFFSTALLFGLVGGVLYLPFYLTFASQAGGIMPSLVFFTRGVHFWVMFGSLLAPIFAWLIWQAARAEGSIKLSQGLLFAAGMISGFWLLSTLAGFIRLQVEPSLAGVWGASEPGRLLLAATANRLSAPGAWLTLLLGFGLAWALLLNAIHRPVEPPDDRPGPAARLFDRPGLFVLLLFLVGVGLTLFPEFFYLRDLFGTRMNTIFKFYFQAWILWSVVAAYASAVLWSELRGAWSTFYRIGWTLLLIVALPYPLFGVLSRTNNFQPAAWTLNGAAYLERFSPDEMKAIAWLQQAPYGVVAEAVGGSYTSFARVSTHSGLPTVLGWPGHESQWRGGAAEIGSREPDIEQLFRARQWQQVSEIIEKYNIRYIFLGSLERSVYRANDELFRTHLVEVFRSNDVIIFEVPRYNSEQGQAFKP